MRRPFQFTPVRSSVDYTCGQAEGHYRHLNRSVGSRNPDDGCEPLRNTQIDAVANLDGSWHLSFRERKPEFVVLLTETIDFLDGHQTDMMHQLGGARNFGGGIVDCSLVNPLYTEGERRRVFDRGKTTTNAMDEKDNRWENDLRPEYVAALNERARGDR